MRLIAWTFFIVIACFGVGIAGVGPVNTQQRKTQKQMFVVEQIDEVREESDFSEENENIN